MERILFTYFFIFLFIFMTNGDGRLKLKSLVRHPCKKSAGAGGPIVLPESSETVVMPDGHVEGCYTMAGPITVKRKITGSIQIYVETRYGASSKNVPCRNYTVDQCGGVGSCVYCDSCEGRKDPNSGSSVNLQITGKQLDCKEGLEAGEYTNLGISFCLPPVNEYLRMRGISRDKWQKYKTKGQSIYQTFYIFNEPINLLKKSNLQTAVRQHRNLIACDAVVCEVTED